MGWTTIATLIAQYGIPFVEFLISKIHTKAAVTPEEWAALKAMANATARDELLARLKAAGIDPASPQGAALLGLVPT
jgi:hypothetical protein